MNKIITSVKSFNDLAIALRTGHACIPVTKIEPIDDFSPDPTFGVLVNDGIGVDLRLRTGPLQNEVAVMDTLMHFQNSNNTIKELNCTLDGCLNVVFLNVVVTSVSPSQSHGCLFHLRFTTVREVDAFSFGGPTVGISMISKITNSKLQFDNLTRITHTECSLEGMVGTSMNREGFGGDIPPYRYKITQDGEDIAIKVMLLSGGSSDSLESDKAFMDALILTFGWVNGGNPYVYSSSHNRGENRIESAIHPIGKPPHSSPRLVRPRFGADSAAGIMECGIRFFSDRTPLTKDLELLLWQYRDATSEGPISLGMLLQGCTLLEGVIGVTLRHSKGLSKTAINKLRMPDSPHEPKRKSTAEERFYHAGGHLGFDWAYEIKPVFTSWKSVRDALAHGNIAEFEQDNADAMLEAYRQVILSFNAICLRLMSYKGEIEFKNSWYPIAF